MLDGEPEHGLTGLGGIALVEQGQLDPEPGRHLGSDVDLAFLVLDVSAGMRHSELTFLQEHLLHSLRPEIVFLANLMDRLELEDREEGHEVLEHISTTLTESLGREPLLIPTISKWGTAGTKETCDAIWAVMRERARKSVERRRRRVLSDALDEFHARCERQLESSRQSVSEIEQQLGDLTSAEQALQVSFERFSIHVRQEGEAPLLEMMRASVAHFRRQASQEMVRRIALTGDLVAYAEHGLTQDIQALVRAWVDRHANEVRRYLNRFQTFAAAEFHRLYGSVLPIGPQAFHFTQSDEMAGMTVDVAALRSRDATTTLGRFAIPAAGSLMAALVATPLAVVGFAGGMALAYQRERRTKEATRLELQDVAHQIVERVADGLEQRLSDSTRVYFEEYDARMAAAFAARVVAARDQLKDALEHKHRASVETADSQRLLAEIVERAASLRREIATR